MKKVFFVFLAWTIFCLCGCASERQEKRRVRYRQSQLTLGTIVHVDVCVSKEDIPRLERTYEALWKRLDRIYRLMNANNRSSDVYRLNHSGGRAVTLNPATYHVLGQAKRYAELTGGAFDVTVLPLIHLWHDAQRGDYFPAADAVKRVRAFVGWRGIELLGQNQARLKLPQSKVHLGGIAKGYALDEIARIIRAAGWHDFYVEAGGDIYVGGQNCSGQPWRIAIRHPRSAKRWLDQLHLQDCAVTTSGDYERYYIFRNQHWSHIINPITGYPQKGIVSATVVAPHAMLADALSTALCVLPPKQGLNLIDRLGGGLGAVIMTADDMNEPSQLYRSRRYKNFQ